MLRMLLEGLKGIVAPKVCHICGCTLTSAEEILCLGCNLQLPRTGSHRDDFNEIHRRLGHHYRVDRAAGWLHYKKGTPYAELLVDAKYRSLPDIDYHLGRMCAQELTSEHFFDGIDLIVPMPMFWFKKFRRGYNQAEEIARAISEVTHIPYACAIKAVKSHGVQARHSREKRYTSIEGTMAVPDKSAVRGRSILLVDDIITSGASCLEALRTLSEAAPSSINILSLALTLRN